MESDMRKRGRDKNTEIERTKREICRERKRCHERLLQNTAPAFSKEIAFSKESVQSSYQSRIISIQLSFNSPV